MKLNKHTSYGDCGDVIFNNINVSFIRHSTIDGPNGNMHVFEVN